MLNQDFTVKMKGYFKNDTYISEAVVGLNYDNKLWNYYPFHYYITFEAGYGVVFYNTLKMEQYSGHYTLNYQLTSGGHISCWEVSFISRD